MGINMSQIGAAFLRMVRKKVKTNINVLGLRMQHKILSNTYGTLAITKQGIGQRSKYQSCRAERLTTFLFGNFQVL
jgi:hypothetical protein